MELFLLLHLAVVSALLNLIPHATQLLTSGEQIDILINNAGTIGPHGQKRLTSEGFEVVWATNFLGHFHLVNRLLPLLRKAAQPRIVVVSSIAIVNIAKLSTAECQSIDFTVPGDFENSVSNLQVYANTKQANVLHVLELQRRYGDWLTVVPSWCGCD